MKEITLNVVQGVGDIFWIIQKFHNHVDKINLNILCVAFDPLQQRSEHFVKLFPKVGEVNYKKVSSEVYDRVAHSTHQMKPILEAEGWAHDYAVNWPLEHGTRLEEIDPEYDVAWKLDIAVSDKRVIPTNYGIVYVSGSKADYTWTPHVWADFIERYIARKNIKVPIVLLGAQYDINVQHQIYTLLKKKKIKVSHEWGNQPEKAIRLIRDADFMIGYQSGLSIIAENYDTPQVMIYFPWLKPMLNTWVKPSSIGSTYKAFTFDEVPTSIIERL